MYLENVCAETPEWEVRNRRHLDWNLLRISINFVLIFSN
jgi:hypothetical protein